MEMSQSFREHESRPNEILQTKFALPRLHTSIVPRNALFSTLDKGLEGKLTLLTAPAGFGKTTLVSTWAARSASGIHVGWISLDENDDDPARFWRYLITASQKFDKTAGRPSLKQLHLSQDLNFKAILTTWINEISRAPGRNALVLDDYHFIQSSQIHDQVTFIVENLPTNMHMVILSRSEPPLPLARLRAQGELLELRSTDLKFSPDEARLLLQDAVPYTLPSETMTYIYNRTDGWVAGLHLVALTLHSKLDTHLGTQFLAQFSRSIRPISEYLVSDVFDMQSEEIQTFLLKTSILNRLTGSLCDAVVGRTGSEEILKQLERANLFILPLDESEQWYHYHALFAEAMRHEATQRYGQEAIRSIYQRAALWYERHGMLADAVEAFLSAQDYPPAALLVQQIVRLEHFTEARELHTLRRWLEKMPEPVIHEHPELCLLYARVLLFTREQNTIDPPPGIEELLRTAERIWESQGNMAKLGEILAFRGVASLLRGEHTQAAARARRALTQLSEDDVIWRSIGLNIIASDDLMAGRLDAANQTLLQSLQLCEMIGNPYATRGTMILLGHAQVGRGELHQAAELYRQTLGSAREDGDLTDQARALLGLAHLSYEWNALDESQQQGEQALQIGIQIHDETLRVQATLLLARISLARRQFMHAQQQIAAVLASLQPHRLPALYREALASRALLQLFAGNFEAVQQWVAARNEFEVSLPVPQFEQEELLVARLLIRRAKRKEALNILSHLKTSAQEAGRIRIFLEFRVVEALAHIVDQDTTTAKHILHEILVLACEEGYIRLFLDERNAIVPLLQSLVPAVRENALVTLYLQSLLAAFAQQDQEQKRPDQTVLVDGIEALTPQEERILILFSSGNTKQEIAEELFISINTVKTHLKRIYQKLTINNRAEARQIARRLDLLQ